MENMIAIEYIVIGCFAIGFIALWNGSDEPYYMDSSYIVSLYTISSYCDVLWLGIIYNDIHINGNLDKGSDRITLHEV